MKAETAFEAGEYDLANDIIAKFAKQIPFLAPQKRVELELLSGQLRRAKGEFDGAKLAFERALAYAKQEDLVELEAKALNQLASIYNLQGDDASSLTMLEQAGDLFKQLGLNNSLASVLNNIGLVYFELAEYENALSHLQQAYTLLKELAPKSRMRLSCKTLV